MKYVCGILNPISRPRLITISPFFFPFFSTFQHSSGRPLIVDFYNFSNDEKNKYRINIYPTNRKVSSSNDRGKGFGFDDTSKWMRILDLRDFRILN